MCDNSEENGFMVSADLHRYFLFRIGHAVWALDFDWCYTDRSVFVFRPWTAAAGGMFTRPSLGSNWPGPIPMQAMKSAW